MVANILDRRCIAMVVGVIVTALACGLCGHIARAQAPAASPTANVFVAESVPVDVTAANVTDARERGLVQGQVAGLRRVLESIVAQEDLGRVPQLNVNQVVEMVRDFSVANERSSAVRYLADLTVRFDPGAVRTLLRRAGIPFTETVSKPIVVLPLLRDGSDQRLWGDGNPWRIAWSKVTIDQGLVPLFLAAADIADTGALSVEQVAGREISALNAFASSYDAGGALVAAAAIVPGAGSDVVQITLTEVRAGMALEEISLSQVAEPGQSRDDLLAAAVRSATAAVEESWRRRNRVTPGVSGRITALVQVAGLSEWLAVRGRLSQVGIIDRIELQALTRDRAQVTIYHAGEQNQLVLAMAQRDLSLTQRNGVWLIDRVRGAKAASSALGTTGTPAAPAPTPAPAP